MPDIFIAQIDENSLWQKEKRGYVYLIGSKLFGWYKIGRSSVPKIRIKDIGVLLPFQIEVLLVWEAYNNEALEVALHTVFKEHRINGEWFFFKSTRIKKIIEDADKAPGATVLPLDANFVPSNIQQDYIAPWAKAKMKNPDMTDEMRYLLKKQRMARRDARPKCIQCGQRINTQGLEKMGVAYKSAPPILGLVPDAESLVEKLTRSRR